MKVLCFYVCLNLVPAWCPWRAEESIRYSGTGSYIQMFVSHRVGSGNLTLVLWKSNHWVISPSLPAHVHYPTESSEFNLALYKEHEFFFPFLFTLETDPFLIAIVPGTGWLLRCCLLLQRALGTCCLNYQLHFIVASFCFICKTLLWLVFSLTVLPSKTVFSPLFWGWYICLFL